MQNTQPDTPLNYVVGISWPRSGHHLLVTLLRRYLGPRFVYCMPYSKAKGINVRSDCCDSALCANRGNVHFCKNHDFKFLVPKVPDVHYLVQYRDFLPSVVSNFELFVKNGNDDTAATFRGFSKHQAEQYNKFIQKWIVPEDRDIHKLVMRYEDMTESTEDVLVQALAFFGLESINRERLQDVIETVGKQTVVQKEQVLMAGLGIRNTRKVEDFRFYAPEWFHELSQIARIAG